VVALTAYTDQSLLNGADVLLPLALPPESEGSYVNIEGRVQTVAAGVRAPGEARPAWRIYKALGDTLQLHGLDFTDFNGASAWSRELIEQPLLAQAMGQAVAVDEAIGGLVVTQLVAAYGGDAVQRRATALQQSPLGAQFGVELHPDDAASLGFSSGCWVANQFGQWPLRISARVPRGSCVVYGGIAPLTGSQVTWTKVSHD
jgi:NADH-quinone oxidoreductase subunit G